MKFLSLLAALVLAAGRAMAQPGLPAAPAAPTSGRVVLPADVRPDRYDVLIRPDAKNLTFTGEEKIALTIRAPTDRIVLNAADIAFSRASLTAAPKVPAGPGQAASHAIRAWIPKVSLDKDQQTATFQFDEPLAPGRFELSLDYSGVIYTQASGLFALDYQTAQGKQRALFTQFENSDARRFIPCWDEPGVKAVYALSVEAPAGQMAVSNMPVAETRTAADGRVDTRFADTPRMSSYLLFFALGDFERIHRLVGKTDVGVVVRRGMTSQAQFALDAAAQLLPYYNDYFGVPYPLPKLDFIAGPGRSQFFAAMENWGAIYYFDYALLVDPRLSTEADKQGIYIDIAHEMAHQWFGDLVTMAWWDDLWLNEGFASWMENKATDHFHPEWQVWLQTKGGEQGAMAIDARSGTHPVITPIRDVFQAATAFDGITYEKGHAVIRMLEDYVGADVFRAGVRNYVAHHAYANTVTDDLWREIDAVSPRKISGIAHDFTLQAGVPLVSAELQAGKLSLEQSRFGADAASQAPRAWRTPVRVAGLAEPWRPLVSAGTPAVHAAAPQAAPLINAGQTGYFRSRYTPELEAALVARFGQLSPEDQLGLIYDSRALGETGYAPMGDFLAIAEKAGAAADPVVVGTLALQIYAFDDYYRGQPGRDAFRAFARAVLQPAFARVGWDRRPGEPDNVALMRRDLLATLGRLDDPAVVAEAHRRFKRLVEDPASLSGADRLTVIGIAAEHADAATWDQLHAMAQKDRDVTDRGRLYAALGSAHDPELVDRALALALSGEPSATDAPDIITAAAGNDADKAFDFIIAHRAQVDAMIEPSSRTSYFTNIAGVSSSPAMPAKLGAFAGSAPASARGEVDKALASVRYRQEVTQKRLPEADRWIAARTGG
jgi:aminopeptidase N